MSAKLSELQQRRDLHAARVADLELELDSLTGMEAIVDVQRLSDELASARRLVAALDRQIAIAEAAQREEALAERERRRTQAEAQAQKLDRDVERLLLQVYDVVVKRQEVTAEFPDMALASTRMHNTTLDLLRASGVQFSTSGLGKPIQPVRSR